MQEVVMTDQYVTGSTIKHLREEKGLTQGALAEKINVTAKAVSRWETGRGLPDISLLEPLSRALEVSVIELLSGHCVQNKNRAANMAKTLFYACPVCGNVIQATGSALVSCCGITLPHLEAESAETGEHRLSIQICEDEYYVTLEHPMTKEHYISFLAAVSDKGTQLVKLYPEETAQARFKIDRVQKLYAFCNHHGLFETRPR